MLRLYSGRLFSKITKMTYKQAAHKLTMIPGPVEFSDDVLFAMATPSQAHTLPEFTKTFQSALQGLRTLFKLTSDKAQGYIVAGSGTLGWDVVGANLINAGDKVLVTLTGFFSDSFADALRVYGADVTTVTADVGNVVSLGAIEEHLKKERYAAITITHVDTSTAVVSSVENISKIVKKVSPETLIVVDGVCLIAVEDLEFDKWGVDFALTGSQKAIGAPAGLLVFFASERAVEKALNKEKDVSFFASLKKWTPIMRAYESGKPAYFATPAIQNITAFNVALQAIFKEGLDARIKRNAEVSDRFKKQLADAGFSILPVSHDVAAHGLLAVYFPKDVDGPKLIAKVAEKGYVIAGGIHKDLVGKYFRVGHMGYSTTVDHVDGVTKAIIDSYNELK